MNIKRGLKRLWVVGTVVWGLFLCLSSWSQDSFIPLELTFGEWSVVLGVPLVFWILLYIGFWVGSGFSNNKKKDETNE